MALTICLAVASVGCGRRAVLLQSESSPPKGTVIRETTEGILENATVSVVVAEQESAWQMTSRDTTVIEREVVAADKVRIVHLMDAAKTTTTRLGKTEEETKTRSLQGIPIIGNRADGKWLYTLETGVPSPEQQKQLRTMEARSSSAALYPSHRVKIGDRWDIDPKAISQFVGSDVLRSSGTGWMKLNSVSRHEGRDCANLSFALQVSASILDDDNTEMTMDVGIEGEIVRALDIYEDLSVSAKGQMKMSGDVVGGEAGTRLTVTGPMIIKSRLSAK